MSAPLLRALSGWSAAPRILTGSISHVRHSHWFPSVLSLKTSLPLRAEPAKKKKKVDPKRDQEAKERLKKRIRKMEKIPPELIPVEDFIMPTKYLDEFRMRSPPHLPSEERERRALLLKEWGRYKHAQHQAEMAAIEEALEAQRKALEELRLESMELYQAALRRDPGFVPFEHQGPSHTPPVTNYQAPEGKYSDITKVYVQ